MACLAKGYRIANFIHDQILVEVSTTDVWKPHAERIKKLMIKGMNEVLPDLKVDVEYAATDRWRKGAKPVFDKKQKLQLWQPTLPKEKKARSKASSAKAQV